ncbi:hypothetical protein TorRG33x02_285960 [Trema orientale]|uniref:Uncharacterized protein n=1 Tax=Trema orientale TaxID=63057 RepID=A0A2P5CGE8_TREOI|nr:hypothetical protein TorRG33x02_285960 [Trema orientale]
MEKEVRDYVNKSATNQDSDQAMGDSYREWEVDNSGDAVKEILGDEGPVGQSVEEPRGGLKKLSQEFLWGFTWALS